MLPPPEKEEVAQMPDEEKQPVQNATTATGHVVQLGVFKNSDKATRLRDRLTVPQDAALHGVDIQIVRRADNQGRQLHYVETATIADKNLAIEMCAMLRNFGQDCITATR